jgi:hypothetical protein
VAHCESEAVVQVGAVEQPVTPLHAEHTRSVVVEHAALWYCPEGQDPEHPRHAPPLRYSPPEHEVHCVVDGPVHVEQELAQAEQTRSAVLEHAALWYLPAGHAPEQPRQAPLLR